MWQLAAAATSASSGSTAAGSDIGSGTDNEQFKAFTTQLPEVKDTWGSGRLLSGTAFSAVLTDDGRVAVGAVAPEVLYAALTAK